MKESPADLDGAALLYFVLAPDDSNFGVAHNLDTLQDIPITALAICRYLDSPGEIYLFACDADWKVRGDLVFNSIEDAKSDAERYYETGPLNWQDKVSTTGCT